MLLFLNFIDPISQPPPLVEGQPTAASAIRQQQPATPNNQQGSQILGQDQLKTSKGSMF